MEAWGTTLVWVRWFAAIVVSPITVPVSLLLQLPTMARRRGVVVVGADAAADIAPDVEAGVDADAVDVPVAEPLDEQAEQIDSTDIDVFANATFVVASQDNGCFKVDRHTNVHDARRAFEQTRGRKMLLDLRAGPSTTDQATWPWLCLEAAGEPQSHDHEIQQTLLKLLS